MFAVVVEIGTDYTADYFAALPACYAPRVEAEVEEGTIIKLELVQMRKRHNNSCRTAGIPSHHRRTVVCKRSIGVTAIRGGSYTFALAHVHGLRLNIEGIAAAPAVAVTIDKFPYMSDDLPPEGIDLSDVIAELGRLVQKLKTQRLLALKIMGKGIEQFRPADDMVLIDQLPYSFQRIDDIGEAGTESAGFIVAGTALLK